MNNIGKKLLAILIQFLVLFILEYLWIEKDIAKAFEIAILITLITNMLSYIFSIFNKNGKSKS